MDHREQTINISFQKFLLIILCITISTNFESECNRIDKLLPKFEISSGTHHNPTQQQSGRLCYL